LTRRSIGSPALLAALALAVWWPPASARQVQFRSAVDVVELNVAVRQGNRVVTGLGASDFDVTDNGVRQDILSISRENTPIDVTLVVDTSESVTNLLAQAIVSAIDTVRVRLRRDDRASVVTFNAVVRERLPLASARAAPLSLGRPTGQTSLNDAIALALAVPPVPDRRQMVLVFTDGFDSSSILTEDDVLAVAGRSPAAVFLVSRAIGSPWLPPMISKEAVGGTAPVLRGDATLPAKFFERLAVAT
jgi:hypothetical protein